MGKRSRLHKMERAAARDMPDEIDNVFDMMSPTMRTDFQEWLRKFQKMMRIKHGSSIVIDFNHEPVVGVQGMRLVTAFVVKSSEAAETA